MVGRGGTVVFQDIVIDSEQAQAFVTGLDDQQPVATGIRQGLFGEPVEDTSG